MALGEGFLEEVPFDLISKRRVGISQETFFQIGGYLHAMPESPERMVLEKDAGIVEKADGWSACLPWQPEWVWARVLVCV